MRIDIITVFPDMIEPPLLISMIGRARERELVQINVVDLRDFTHDRHRTTDDYPFGGGHGMIMKPEPIFEAIDSLSTGDGRRIILLSPQGETFNQHRARDLAGEKHLVLICGHYEGIDERVRTAVTDELSIGDYVLTGGELPALVITDTVVRLLPGVLGADIAPDCDSFGTDGLLEGPQYTRPREYRGMEVPQVLLSGDHARIENWRRRQSIVRTAERRPDLLAQARLTDEERSYLDSLFR